MKKILTILFVLCAAISRAQYPLTQNLASDSTLVTIGKNSMGTIKGGIIPMAFTDTTAANLTRIKDYGGSIIWTTSDSSLWVRNRAAGPSQTSSTQYWFKIGGAGGGATGSFWNLTGNTIAAVPAGFGIGTNSTDNLPFKTDGTTRVILPSTGLARQSGGAWTTMMFDTTNKTWGYGNGYIPTLQQVFDVEGKTALMDSAAENTIQIRRGVFNISNGERKFLTVNGNIDNNYVLINTDDAYGSAGQYETEAMFSAGENYGNYFELISHRQTIDGLNHKYASISGDADNSILRLYAQRSSGVIDTVSYIYIYHDSISIKPEAGKLNIDSLRTWSSIGDTLYKKPMTWDTRNGRWEYAANWFGNGSASYTASNGLTLSGSNFKLGGTLGENTTITQDGFTLGISDLLNFADTTNWKPVVVNTTGSGASAGTLRKATYWPVGSGGGGSPAGNFGNLQINRNGAFATPGSDSLDFESATGLTVKGGIRGTTLGVNGAAPTATYAADIVSDGTYTTNLRLSNAATPTSFLTMNSVYGDVLTWGSLFKGSELLIAQSDGIFGISQGAKQLLRFTANDGTYAGRRFQTKQGADVSSAGNLTLGGDGNVFEITGTTTINLIANTNWQNGAVIRLVFASTPTVTNNAGTSGSNINILLAGGANFSATANDVLTLMLCEVGGTQNWVEVSRSVN